MGSRPPERYSAPREYVRHTVDVPLVVERDDENAPHPEHGLNVSHGGLAFSSATCPHAGEILRIRIPTVDPPFDARARVVWCRPEGDRFLVGVEFLDADTAFRSRMVQQVCAIERFRAQALERDGRALTSEEAATEWIARYADRFPGSGSDTAG